MGAGNSHDKQAQTDAPSLGDLRKEIDRIDEAMHRLLMERGEIIDRLIAVKKTQESGSAFRPAREADMMRRLVAAPPRHPAARHRREHLARHHRDLHLCAGAVLGARRPVGRRRHDARQRALSFRLHGAVRAACRRGRRGRGGVGIARAISAWCRRSPPPAAARGGPRSNSTARRRSSRGCRSSTAPTIRRALPVFVVSRAAADAMVTEVEMWSVRVAGWSAKAAARRVARSPRSIAVPDSAFDGAALLVSVPAGGDLTHDQGRARQGRRHGALGGPRRQPRDPLYGAGRQAVSRSRTDIGLDE